VSGTSSATPIDLAGVATPERDVRRSELLTALVGGSALSWLHRYVRFKLELGFIDMKLGVVGRGAGHPSPAARLTSAPVLRASLPSPSLAAHTVDPLLIGSLVCSSSCC
jgi:hypothetical protein